MFDKELDMFFVAMYEKTEYGMKKHATLPMITGQVKHSESYAEDAAENWVHGRTALKGICGSSNDNKRTFE